MLQQIDDPALRVLVVWEPILPEDRAKPPSGALARIHDGRAIQYWDPTHQVATKLRQAGPAGQREPECCEAEGILWDVAAVFGKEAQWTDLAPRAEFLNGPVVKAKAEMATALRQKVSSPNPRSAALHSESTPIQQINSRLLASPRPCKRSP